MYKKDEWFETQETRNGNANVTVLQTTSQFYRRRHSSTDDVTVLQTTSHFYRRRHSSTNDVTENTSQTPFVTINIEPMLESFFNT